jgi:hypothetical protein
MIYEEGQCSKEATILELKGLQEPCITFTLQLYLRLLGCLGRSSNERGGSRGQANLTMVQT